MFIGLPPDVIREIAGHLHITDALSMVETCRSLRDPIDNGDWWRSRTAHDYRLFRRFNDTPWRFHYICLHTGTYPGLRWSYIGRMPIEHDLVKIVKCDVGLVGLSRSGEVYTIGANGKCSPLYYGDHGCTDIFGADGHALCIVDGNRFYMYRDRGAGELPARIAQVSSSLILDVDGNIWRWAEIDRKVVDVGRITAICGDMCVDIDGNLLYVDNYVHHILISNHILDVVDIFQIPFNAERYTVIYTITRDHCLWRHVAKGRPKVIMDSIKIFGRVRRASVGNGYIYAVDDICRLWKADVATAEFCVVPNIRVFDMICPDQDIMVKCVEM